MGMAKTKFTITRKPRSPKQLLLSVQEAQKKNLVSVANQHTAARRRIVSNWKNKPIFSYRITITGTKILFTIFVSNASRPVGNYGTTIGDIWQWIDFTGTDPHPISARNAPYLHFQAGNYLSKTGANPARFGGPGTISGAEWVKVETVEHPGFPAREFWKALDKDLRPEYINALRRGVRQGMKNAS
jgi:hypothetical protein